MLSTQKPYARLLSPSVAALTDRSQHRQAAMKPSIALQAHRDEIRRVVESHRAKNARIFGSVALGEDTEDSDLDLLIDPTPKTSLLDIGAIRFELRELLGVKVDVLTPRALPDRTRDAILAGAIPV
jgi:uncharacterized protein